MRQNINWNETSNLRTAQKTIRFGRYYKSGVKATSPQQLAITLYSRNYNL